MIRHVRAKPAAILLVCQKCPKRIGAKDWLSKPLKRLLKPHGVKLVRTRCVGVCPKNAIVLHDSRKPREWVIVGKATAAEAVATDLLAGVGGVGQATD